MNSQSTISTNSHSFIKKYYWEEKQTLCSGPFSSVYKIFNIERHAIECVKVIALEPSILTQIKKQIDKQAQVENQHFAKHQTYLIEDQLYVRMPLFEESLKDVLEKKSPSPTNIVNFIQKMVSIMTSSKNGPVIHGNLKPSNIFIKNKEYHLSDYGFQNAYAQKQEQLAGQGIYSAPEFVMNHKITHKSDIWSFGLIIFQMIFGYLPWPHRNLKSYKSFILKYPLSFPYDAQISDRLKDFIHRCLILDEHSRMSWQKAAHHPLVLEGKLGNPINIFQFEKNQKIGISLLLKLQTEIVRKSKSVKRIIETIHNRPFDLGLFKKICEELNNQMIDDEIVSLYQTLRANEGCSNWDFLKRVLLEVDFRPKNNITSRFMKQLSEMAVNKQLQIQEIKKILKHDQSEFVAFPNFLNLVLMLLPHIPHFEIQKIWAHLEKENNKCIKSSNMVKNIQLHLLKKPSKNEKQKVSVELEDFRQSFQQYGNVTVHQMITFFDKNNDKMIGFSEFKEMVNSLFKFVSDNDLKMMFDDIDRDHSGKISGDEIKDFLKSR